MRAIKIKLRKTEQTLREMESELAQARTLEAQLRAQLDKEKAMQRELVASLVRNKEKAKNARKRLRAAQEVKRDFEQSRDQCIVDKGHLLRHIRDLRAQLGWPIDSCENRPDALASGRFLLEGGRLVSQNGRYRLEVRRNGQVEAYDTLDGNRVFWSSRTPRLGSGDYRLTVTNHGNVELTDNLTQTLWQSGGRAPGKNRVSCFLLQNDRSLVLYGSCGRKLWSSDTEINDQQTFGDR